MDGDIAPLDKISALAKKYACYTYIDECHATGFIGPSGKGTPELFAVQKEIDVVSGTLGKALGGASGGYTTGRKEIVEMLR
jgi:glycine C-acetyltransferase